MRNRKQSTVYFIIILLFFSILNILAVTKVVAPPIGGSSSSGFITSTGSEIQIVEARINMSITSQLVHDAYHLHTIQLQGLFNMTNPSSENEVILLLYSPYWEESWSYYNTSSFESFIEGSPLVFNNQTLSNVTHPRELPSDFHDRFPDWVYLHNQTWFSSTPFTLLNLSLGPYQSVIFHFNDLITVTSVSIHYSEVGFGLAPDQIERDSTQIRMQIIVINGDQFIDVISYPHDHLVDSHEENDYCYAWNAQPPYSSKLTNGFTPYPIGAGFEVKMVVTEYFLPTVETTTSTPTTTSSTTTSSNPILTILPDLIVISVGWGVFIVVIIFFWKSQKSNQ